MLFLSPLQIALPEFRSFTLKGRQSPVQLPDNVVQPLHEFCAMRTRLDSAELTYAFAHCGEIRIPRGVPLRPDGEQVGLEDFDVLEFSYLPRYAQIIS